MQPKLDYKCGDWRHQQNLQTSWKTYETTSRWYIKNTNRRSSVHKSTYNKIQEKVLSLSIVLFQVEPISRLGQLIPLEIC